MEDRKYPCEKCGTLRTEAEGGKIFTVCDDCWGAKKKNLNEFKAELEQLINKHGVESIADMPDFLLAEMICNMIEAMGPSIKRTLDWHGCSSVCHGRPGPGAVCGFIQHRRDEGRA